MPTLSSNKLNIEYTDAGQGPPVILIHSSVSGNRQWGALIGVLIDRYRVLAINLYGYGETTPWHERLPQSLDDQVKLVQILCSDLPDPVSLVGHSFGGSVAMKVALQSGIQVNNLVLLEPNPFWLLKQHEKTASCDEVQALADHVRSFGKRGDWQGVAARFADYWLGDGAWSEMPENRREVFCASLPPNLHEWDAVMNEQTTAGQFKTIPARTMLVHDRLTVTPILDIVDILTAACPHWQSEQISNAGHMAPLTHPHLVNPLIAGFLDSNNP